MEIYKLVSGGSSDTPSNTGTATFEYPPAAIGSTNSLTLTGQFYGNGTYTVTASSDVYSPTLYTFRAFDKSVPTTTEGWISANGKYTIGSGALVTAGATSTFISSVETLGEWIQLQMTTPIVLKSYGVTSINFGTGSLWSRCPNSWKLAGSNDGTTWNLLDTQPNVGYTGYNQLKLYNVNTATSYNRYRLVFMSTGSGTDSSSVFVGEVSFFG
jgi:hypothetical protein